MSRNNDGDGGSGYWDASKETGKSAKGTSRGRSCGSAKWSDGRQSGKGWAGDDYIYGARRSNYSWNRGGKPYRDASGKYVRAASPPPPPPDGAGSSTYQVAPDIAAMAIPSTESATGFVSACRGPGTSSIPVPSTQAASAPPRPRLRLRHRELWPAPVPSLQAGTCRDRLERGRFRPPRTGRPHR